MSVTSGGGALRTVLVGTQDGAILTGVTSGSTHPPANCAGYTNLTVYVIATALCSAGTLIIEERDQGQDTPGTIATITLTSPFAAAGGTYAYHLPTACYGLISARIGTTVTGTGATVAAVLRAV